MARRIRYRVRVTQRRRVTYRRQVRTQTRQMQPAPKPTPRQVTPTPNSTRSVSTSQRRQLSGGRSPVVEIGENIREVFGDESKEYDVFVCHASPDKHDCVSPLAHALKDGGLEVWYDEFELRVGDSLRRKIDQGIRSARYGIVVLSPSFLGGRPWTEHELDGIVNAFIYNRQVLLPIWHDVDHSDVMEYSPSLADKVALSTSELSVEEIAEELIRYIGGTNDQGAKP